jgi:mono/diheme cytochrome c family protein
MKVNRINQIAAIVATLALTAFPALSAMNNDWRDKVPDKFRARTNPLNDDAEAAAAGAKLFQHDCASCHGADATGRGSRPSLKSDRVHNATDGELDWLLRNGSMARGMPSWSRLPEAERWQIVRYLRTLPVEKLETPRK